MSVVSAINGIAPKGLNIGDIVTTNGGNYSIVQHGTPGSSYNPVSGYSSIKVGANPESTLVAYNQAQAERNTARSESNAQKQMDYQSMSNAKAMEFSAEQAKINRSWQERMSNTAHQREVADLIAAGLNPVLSTKFAGASTPTGASASGVSSTGSMGQVDSSSSQLVNTLLSAVIAQSTALQTTAMNNATNLQASNIGLSGIIGAADITAKNRIELQNVINEFDEYIKKNYPQTPTGGISSLFQTIAEGMTGNSSGKSNSNLLKAMKVLNNILAPDPRTYWKD